jgi:hypothetical protein
MRFKSSDMLTLVGWSVVTDLMDDLSSSIFSAKQSKKCCRSDTAVLLCVCIYQPTRPDVLEDQSSSLLISGSAMTFYLQILLRSRMIRV